MMPRAAFEQLERQKAEVRATLADWSAARLAHRPTPDTWSATEVLDHLVRVETNILAAARRGIATPHPLGVRDRVAFWLLDRLFRSERRVRVPRAAAAVLPASDVAFVDACARWDATRLDLDAFLTPLTPEQCRSGVFRHPVSGWMTVPQVLRFFWVHTHHHRFQLARLHAAAEGR